MSDGRVKLTEECRESGNKQENTASRRESFPHDLKLTNIVLDMLENIYVNDRVWLALADLSGDICKEVIVETDACATLALGERAAQPLKHRRWFDQNETVRMGRQQLA